jgi:hypothetical protein
MTDLHCLLDLLENVPDLDKPIGKPWKFEIVNFIDGHLGRKEGRSLKQPLTQISSKESMKRKASPIEATSEEKRPKLKENKEISSEEKRDDLYHRMFEILVGEAVAREIDSSFHAKKQKRDKRRTSISINDIIN